MPARPPSALRVALRPGLLALHVVAVAALVLCVVMGFWQLGVYDARQASERADRQRVPTVALDEALGPDEPFTTTANHRPVRVEGTFGPAAEQRWVPRAQDGRDGYWLLAPVLTGGTGDDGRPTAVVVVRGWSPTTDDPPAPPAGTVGLRGVLEPGEARSTAADPPARDDVLDAVRIPLLANELPYDLYSGFVLVTDPAPADGLTPVPPPAPDTSWTTGLTNLAYALQWWVFGAFAVFMWWRITRDVVDRERAAWDAAWAEEAERHDGADGSVAVGTVERC